MVELLIPIARNLIVNQRKVPMSLTGEVSGVFNGTQEAKNIGYAYGRSNKPKKPLLLWGPDAKTLMVIIGDGDAEAAELEDLALAQLAKAEATVKRTGRALDFDALREKHRLMRREDADASIRQAFIDHANKRRK